MNFSRGSWVTFSRNFKSFLITPRKINAIIPALTVYAVWMIGIGYSNVLGFIPISSISRDLLAFSSTLFAFLFVYFSSKILLSRKTLLFWPIVYACTMAVVVVPIFLYWFFIFDLGNIELLILYVRLVFLVSVTESIVGFLIFQIELRRKELQEYQVSLVTFEEKFRSSISSYLHDKIQSRLFSVGIQLNEIKSDLDSDYAKKVDQIISQIETIRVSDVRKTIVEIMPPISPVGLTVSLLTLLKSHQPVLQGKFSNQLAVPLTNEEEERFGIGIYRIIEQGLVNSLVHGHASEIEVMLSEVKSKLLLRITNNGKPLEVKTMIKGHGFAVIDGWVSTLKGEWSIFNDKDQVCLEARFDRQIS
jgi:signal transduction histidine kinase